ncbi:hypothetical protein KV679_18975 [Bacillus sp. JRC01]|nr:hypothetical protein [Bacillus sp. JRC01]
MKHRDERVSDSSARDEKRHKYAWEFYLQTNRQEFVLLFPTSVLQRRSTDSSGNSRQERPCRLAEAAHRPPRRKAVDRSGKTRPICGLVT